MAAVWSGAISFGLVHIPVRLMSATTEHDLPLHQVHDEDGGRIAYERVCRVCGEKVPYEHIDRAYEEGDQRVILTRDDLDGLPAAGSHEIAVLEFVPSEQIDPIRLERSYFLEPQDRAHKPYVLLREALQDSERTAVATVSLRQRTRLATLRVHADVIVLQTLRWDDEVRSPAAAPDEVRLTKAERDAARALVDSLSAEFDPARFRDEYADQLRELVTSRLDGGDTMAVPDDRANPDEAGQVLDLMEALRRSVGKSAPAKKAARAPKSPGKRTPATKKPAASRKKPAKKTSARSA